MGNLQMCQKLNFLDYCLTWSQMVMKNPNISKTQTIENSLILIKWCSYVQMWDLAIKHLNYWFWISSILERVKNSTKTNNISFERSDSKHPKSWRLGAWHSHWPTMPTFYNKLHFFRKRGRGKPLILPCSCPPGIILFTLIGFKLGIVCLSAIFSLPVNRV